MKKILLGCMIVLVLLTGCGKLDNTPKKKAEEFFNKYQTLDKRVLEDLDAAIAKETRFNSEQREKYRDMMKKHYQNLAYIIKDERIDGDRATVTVEITVMDYAKVLNDADNYLQANPDEFKDESGNYDESKFMDYRLDKVKKATEKVKYTLDLKLSLIDKEWQLDQVSNDDLDKINGVYNS